jgi:hypothetical protein
LSFLLQLKIMLTSAPNIIIQDEILSFIQGYF